MKRSARSTFDQGLSPCGRVRVRARVKILAFFDGRAGLSQPVGETTRYARPMPPEAPMAAPDHLGGRMCHEHYARQDPPLTSRYYVGSIPTGVRLRAGFDSGRGDCGDWNGMGVPAAVEPAVLFLPANT